MEQKYKLINKTILIVFALFIIVFFALMPAYAELSFTDEEKAYIASRSVIKAGSIVGVAPIQYYAANGKIDGISISVLDLMSEMSGLTFEYRLYASVEECRKSDEDILFGISSNYATDQMILSQPYLKSKTILYINKSLKLYNLEDKTYAAVSGSSLPVGVKQENSIYFNTREESLNAVEKGRADYGFGNNYSVMFYRLQNNYKNIIVIPKEKEEREYCIALLKKDDILLSIINKTISAIDDDKMQSIILNDTTNIHYEINISMIIERYGIKLFTIVFMVLGILLTSFIYNLRANKELKLQNKKHHVLSNISNEYLYEYNLKNDNLLLSEKYSQLIKSQKTADKITQTIKNMLTKFLVQDLDEPITLLLESGEERVFKAINAVVADKTGSSLYVVGKLVDITKEAEEKKRLIAMAQLDGLTGLYNPVTTARLIKKRIENKDNSEVDALVLLDCDNFKNINDTFGHLVGDEVLKYVALCLKQLFRKNDIVGRMGGDEFCVYIKEIPSLNFIDKKIIQLNKMLSNNKLNGVDILVSVGVAFVREKETYEKVFKKADDALYKAKNNEKGTFEVHKG